MLPYFTFSPPIFYSPKQLIQVQTSKSVAGSPGSSSLSIIYSLRQSSKPNDAVTLAWSANIERLNRQSASSISLRQNAQAFNQTCLSSAFESGQHEMFLVSHMEFFSIKKINWVIFSVKWEILPDWRAHQNTKCSGYITLIHILGMSFSNISTLHILGRVVTCIVWRLMDKRVMTSRMSLTKYSLPPKL